MMKIIMVLIVNDEDENGIVFYIEDVVCLFINLLLVELKICKFELFSCY